MRTSEVRQAGGNPSFPGWDGLLLMSIPGVKGQGPPLAAAFELHPAQMTRDSVDHPQCGQPRQELLLGASQPNMQTTTCGVEKGLHFLVWKAVTPFSFT